MEIKVGIAEYRFSEQKDDVLVTYALGSCIAVVLHDPRRLIAGLIHYMLPLSIVSPEKARATPGMFADTGVPLLFTGMYARGCKKEELVVKVIGGGQLYDDSGFFDIGRRNYATLRAMFKQNAITIAREEVGGSQSRTVRVWASNGRVVISSHGKEHDL